MWPPASSKVKPSTICDLHNPPARSLFSRTTTVWPSLASRRPSVVPEMPAPRMAIFNAVIPVGRTLERSEKRSGTTGIGPEKTTRSPVIVVASLDSLEPAMGSVLRPCFGRRAVGRAGQRFGFEEVIVVFVVRAIHWPPSRSVLGCWLRVETTGAGGLRIDTAERIPFSEMHLRRRGRGGP